VEPGRRVFCPAAVAWGSRAVVAAKGGVGEAVPLCAAGTALGVTAGFPVSRRHAIREKKRTTKTNIRIGLPLILMNASAGWDCGSL
jgi:hypothetical protein